MIRSPMPSDRRPIGHVYCSAWKAAYQGIVPNEYLNTLTAENCAPRSVRPDSTLVFEADGQVVGVAAFGTRRDCTDEKSGELYSVYVLPKYWRMGAGRTLFEAARNQLRKDGYESLFLWVLTETSAPAAFMKKWAWKPAKPVQ